MAFKGKKEYQNWVRNESLKNQKQSAPTAASMIKTQKWHGTTNSAWIHTIKAVSESYYGYPFNAPSRIQNELKYLPQYCSLCLRKLKIEPWEKINVGGQAS